MALLKFKEWYGLHRRPIWETSWVRYVLLNCHAWDWYELDVIWNETEDAVRTSESAGTRFYYLD